MSSSYGAAFDARFGKKRPILLPVIHIYDPEQALRLAQYCFDAGCDGVWLIEHGNNTLVSRADGGRNKNLIDSFLKVKAKFPNWFVGINNLYLSQAPMEIFDWIVKNCPGCDGIWTDESFSYNPDLSQRLVKAREQSSFKGLYFGGVGLKYQREIVAGQDNDDPSESIKAALVKGAANAKAYMDVVTTSGTKTGGKPSVEKLKAMHKGACPLAVSGCGFDFDKYHENVDVFFAATSLQPYCKTHNAPDHCSESFCELDPEKLKKWVEASKSVSWDFHTK